MSKIRVPLFGQPRGYRDIDPDATAGATIGVNVFNKDGSLFVPAEATGGGTTIVNGVAYTHVKIPDATYAVLATDDKKIFEFTFAGAVTVTVSGLIPFSSGFDIAAFCSGSGGQATFAGTNGMTLTSSDSLKTRTQYSTVGLMVDEANQATLYGDIEPVAPALSALVRSVNSAGVPVWLSYTDDGHIIIRRAGALVSESFDEAVDDRVATLLVAGTNMAITYNDVSNTITLDATVSLPPETDKTITYDGSGRVDVVTDSYGTKTMAYDGGGRLIGITGTGDYPSKTFSYTGDQLTGIDVL